MKSRLCRRQSWATARDDWSVARHGESRRACLHADVDQVSLASGASGMPPVAVLNRRLRHLLSQPLGQGSYLCVYLLVVIAKGESALPGNLHQVLQVISIAVLEKITLPELLAKIDTTNDVLDTGIQFEISRF